MQHAGCTCGFRLDPSTLARSERSIEPAASSTATSGIQFNDPELRALWQGSEPNGSKTDSPAERVLERVERYREEGRFREAETLFTRVLEALTRAGEQQLGERARMLTRLAVWRENEGDIGEAEDLFQQSLADLEEVYGLDHEMVHWIVREYADFLKRIGKPNAAARLSRHTRQRRTEERLRQLREREQLARMQIPTWLLTPRADAGTFSDVPRLLDHSEG
ncbi:hypothetical protein GF324_14070 [bacterium]|nr:hypothetical protein [bacterium]